MSNGSPITEAAGLGHRSIVALRMYQAREAFNLLLFGALVGILAGLASVALNVSVHLLQEWRNHFRGEWLLILLPGLGAGAGIFIQQRFFGDHSGHGVPDVIHSVTSGRGLLPRRMMLSRLVSSSLTVGFGGAAGLEGPIVAAGGALGSFVAQTFQFSQRRRCLMIACGTAGAIAGIFNAPLTGMIFSLEVILGEWKSRNLVPTVTAAAFAAQVSRMLMGHKIPFPREEITHSFPDLPAFILLGVVCAFTGRLMVKSLQTGESLFSKLNLSQPVRAGLGGLCVGLVAFWIPEAMGEGYESIRAYISNDHTSSLLLVAGLFLLRMITTSLTIGSGGAGGIFAPALFFGASVGLLFGTGIRALDPLVHFAEPGAYALVGMAGLVAGIMSAPLTGMFLILEICGSYDLILPLMLTTLVSMLVWRYLEEGSVYTKALIEAGTFRRRGSEVQLLADVEIAEVVSPCPLVYVDQTLGDLVQEHGSKPDRVFALADRDGVYQGLIFLDDLRAHLFEPSLYQLIAMAGIADRGVPTLGANATPDMAWLAFTGTNREALAVLDGADRVVGIVTKARLFDLLQKEVLVHD